ncbi:MAG: metallophosphoesterase [Deltaproteobacteria bacterium]|uniref:Metallophosphoesterase n=1 Tax=Candidatus Zymogenus saltonus TaxID=2844893 RepID=A0A9D8PIS1_9DELT|nr:metallophosphoesterase [Candidatus Zymogenus saltonus]
MSKALFSAVISITIAVAVLFGVGANSAEIVIGPVLEFPGADRMTIFWETDVAAVGGIALVVGGGAERIRSTVLEASTAHRVVLNELLPATEYSYSVLADGVSLYTSKFKTLPAEGDYRVVLVGDIHAPAEPFSTLAPLIERKSPDFVVLLGDLVCEGENRHEWDSLFELGRNLFDHVPVFPVIGDHDFDRGDGVHLYERFFSESDDGGEKNRYYVENICGDLFIFLDVESGGIRQWIWFADTLMKAAQDAGRGRIYVLSHEGVVSFKGNRKGCFLLKHFLGIMSYAGVSALISGHDHHFVAGRTHNGIDFFVTGGGGGALYDINPENFYAKFVGVMEESYKGYHFLVMDVSDKGFTVTVVNQKGEEIYRKEVKEPR